MRQLFPAVLLMVGACSAPTETSWRHGDWPVWGGDSAGTKYSPLDQIQRENIGDLEVAWSWHPKEKPIPGPRQPVPGKDVRPGAFEGTPLVIDGVMYLSTPYNRVVALESQSGKEIWAFDPKTYEWGQPPNGTGFVHRGVAVWRGREGTRIFLNTRWRLIALDAATGLPVADFGSNGEIDLTEHLLWRSTHR